MSAGFDCGLDWSLFFGTRGWARWAPLISYGGDVSEVARRCGGGIVYLATPYSHQVVRAGGAWDQVLSVAAMERAAGCAARAAAAGVTALSPVVLSAAICHATAQIDPLDARFWRRWCAPLLAVSGLVWVPDLPGWHRSAGIWHEVRAALEHNVPVVFGAEVVPRGPSWHGA